MLSTICTYPHHALSLTIYDFLDLLLLSFYLTHLILWQVVMLPSYLFPQPVGRGGTGVHH